MHLGRREKHPPGELWTVPSQCRDVPGCLQGFFVVLLCIPSGITGTSRGVQAPSHMSCKEQAARVKGAYWALVMTLRVSVESQNRDNHNQKHGDDWLKMNPQLAQRQIDFEPIRVRQRIESARNKLKMKHKLEVAISRSGECSGPGLSCSESRRRLMSAGSELCIPGHNASA